MRIGDNGFRSDLYRDLDRPPTATLQLLATPVEGETSDGYYPDRWSLLPAFLAIALAILSGRVVPSLLIGCVAGAALYTGGLVGGAAHFAVGTVWDDVLTSRFNLEIVGFVVFLFMTVGVMARSGGIQGMVEWIRGYARGPVSAQLCSYAIGILIFFDDYSNCIITGTTMRPLTDKVGVAREKLAYIVDSTAAPIAGVSIFSTWVAYEVSTFANQLPEVTKEDGTPFTQSDGFAVFVQTLPFRFYCLFTLIMVAATILTRREFGPMLKAARRAWHDRQPVAPDAQPMVADGLARTEPPEGAPQRGINALLPILLLVVATITLIVTFGTQAMSPQDWDRGFVARVATILGNGESQRALCYAAAMALVLAVALAVGQGILTVADALASAWRSAQSLVFAIVILVLAWSIGNICSDLGTAPFLTAAFYGSFPPWLLPVVMFLLSSMIAFSTGTSYGTMAILLPNIVVLAHTMGTSMPELGGPALMVLTIGAVLEGSIFGDHCSPISDTTVLSSVSTGSDHLHHVRTQAPYAVAVMAIAIVCGYVPAAWLGPAAWPICWAVGLVTIFVLLFVVGRRPDVNPEAAAAAR